MSVAFAGPEQKSQVSELLRYFNPADPSARSQLLNHARTRLRGLAHVLIRTNPVGRWEGSDDLLQQTLMRLDRSLRSTPIGDSRSFYNLAALEMRHALIDFGRSYFGPHGPGANHASDPKLVWSQSQRIASVTRAASDSPESQLIDWERWERLYRAIDQLPQDEREVVNLLWFLEMTQVEVAALLDVATKTVARRWRRARLQLATMLGDEF